MDDKELREAILGQIRAGRLPSASTKHTLFGGKGDGDPCACCGRLITSAQIQFEVDFTGVAVVEMHLNCHDEWVKASTDLKAPPSPSAR